MPSPDLCEPDEQIDNLTSEDAQSKQSAVADGINDLENDSSRTLPKAR